MSERCVQCNKPVDTREVEDGGSEDGCELYGGGWVCSRECWAEYVDGEFRTKSKRDQVMRYFGFMLFGLAAAFLVSTALGWFLAGCIVFYYGVLPYFREGTSSSPRYTYHFDEHGNEYVKDHSDK